jgi:hypothetical protein
VVLEVLLEVTAVALTVLLSVVVVVLLIVLVAIPLQMNWYPVLPIAVEPVDCEKSMLFEDGS